MLRLLLLSVLVSTGWSYEAWVVSAPGNVKLSDGAAITKAGDVLETLEALLGISTNKCSFDGVTVQSPFHAASSLLLLSVETDSGRDRIFASEDGAHFPLKRDVALDAVLDSLDASLGVKFGDEAAVRRMEERVDGDEPSPFELSALSAREFPDVAFLRELSRLLAAADQMEDLGQLYSGPQVVWASIHALPLVQMTYGKSSPQAGEAERLLRETIRIVDRELRDRSMAMVTISGDGKLLRQKRETVNLAEGENDANFTAIFQIMIWFSIIFFLALIYISVGIGNMDPGKDSIIYRLTSNPNPKKDN